VLDGQQEGEDEDEDEDEIKRGETVFGDADDATLRLAGDAGHYIILNRRSVGNTT
jgi:hypothetical protein